MLFTKFQSLKLSNKLKSLKVAKLKDDDGWVSGGGGTMVWGFVVLVVVDGLFESVCDSMCDGVYETDQPTLPSQTFFGLLLLLA